METVYVKVILLIKMVHVYVNHPTLTTEVIALHF